MYYYEECINGWHIRCLTASASYIRANLSDLFDAIETEYFDALAAQALPLIQKDGTLAEAHVHPHVRLPVALPRTPELPNDLAVSGSYASSHGGERSSENGRNPTITMVVPDELRDARHIVVWQDLQAKKTNFEKINFLSFAAQAAIEIACEVKIVRDYVQKAIFIGSASSMGDVLKVKAMLTTLLQDHHVSARVPIPLSFRLLLQLVAS